MIHILAVVRVALLRSLLLYYIITCSPFTRAHRKLANIHMNTHTRFLFIFVFCLIFFPSLAAVFHSLSLKRREKTHVEVNFVYLLFALACMYPHARECDQATERMRELTSIYKQRSCAWQTIKNYCLYRLAIEFVIDYVNNWRQQQQHLK